MKLLSRPTLKATVMVCSQERRYFLLHRQMGFLCSLVASIPEEKITVAVLGYCDIDPYEDHLLNQEAGRLDDEMRTQIEDDQERFAKVQAILSERYPNRRGVKLLLDKFFELIDNPA